MRDTKEAYQTISETFLQIVNEQSEEEKIKIMNQALGGMRSGGTSLTTADSRQRPGGVQKKDADPPRVGEGTHLALDAAGLIPAVGNFADLLNAALYAAEERPGMATLSLGAAIPGIGLAAGAGKFGARATGLLGKAGAAGKAVGTAPAKGIAIALEKGGATSRAGRALTKAEQILRKQSRHTPDEISDAIKSLSKLDPSRRLGIRRGLGSGGAEAIAKAGKEAGESLSGFSGRNIDIGPEAWKQVQKAQDLLAGKRGGGVLDPDNLLHAKRLFSVPGATSRAALVAGSEIEALGHPGEEGELGAAAQKTRAKGHASKAGETAIDAYTTLQDLMKEVGFTSGSYGY